MVAYYLPQLVPNLSGPFAVESGLAVSAFALWRGRRYERFIAFVLLSSLILGILLSAPLSDPHDSLVLWWEGLEFILLAWLAARDGAFWLILVAAIQLLCLVTVVVHRWAPDVAGGYTYDSLYIIWEVQFRIVLLFATLAAIRRTKAEGGARSGSSGSKLLGQIKRLGRLPGKRGAGWWRITAR